MDQYRSPVASVGLHLSDSELEASSCPPANRKGCYRLTYSVAIVGDAERRAAALR